MLFGEGIRNARSSAYKIALFSERIVDISLMYISEITKAQVQNLGALRV